MGTGSPRRVALGGTAPLPTPERRQAQAGGWETSGKQWSGAGTPRGKELLLGCAFVRSPEKSYPAREA